MEFVAFFQLTRKYISFTQHTVLERPYGVLEALHVTAVKERTVVSGHGKNFERSNFSIVDSLASSFFGDVLPFLSFVSPRVQDQGVVRKTVVLSSEIGWREATERG